MFYYSTTKTIKTKHITKLFAIKSKSPANRAFTHKTINNYYQPVF